MTVSWSDLLALLEQGESQSLEFEKILTTEEDIARELVGFSNSDGGKLIFGIDDKNKHLLGVPADESTIEWIQQIGANHCTPLIALQVEIIGQEDRRIVVVTIPEGDEKPYRTDDICYIRDGALSRPARDEEEEAIKSPWAGQGLNKRQKRALAYVSEHGVITNREFRELFNVSHKTAHIEMTMLEDKKIVVSLGSGRSTRYVLPEHAPAPQKQEVQPS